MSGDGPSSTGGPHRADERSVVEGSGGRPVLRRLAWLLVLVPLAAGLVMCERVGERGRYVAPFSTYGAGPEGTRGAFLQAEALGAHPRRWAEDLGRLPERGMLVALGSCERPMRRPLGRIERQNLRRWVEAGGVLVVAGVPDYLTREDFGVRLRADAACRSQRGILDLLSDPAGGPAPDGVEGDGDEDGDEDGDANRNDAPRDLYGDPGDFYEPLPEGVSGDPSGGPDPVYGEPTDSPYEPDPYEDRGVPGQEPDLDALEEAFARDPGGTYQDLAAEDAIGPPEVAVGVASPFEGMPAVGLRAPMDVVVDEARSSRTLLRLDSPDGRVVGVRVDVGEGAVIALASGSAFSNRDLSTQGGGVLFARLLREHAGEGPVLFDEYHLGIGERRSTMRYLRQVGGGAVVLQFLLLLAFLLWRGGAKFGGDKRPGPPEPAGTASYVEGIGTLYAKSKDPVGAAAILAGRLLERISAHHHLDGHDPEKLAEQLEARRQPDAAKAVRALAARLVAGPGRAGLAAFTAELDALSAPALAALLPHSTKRGASR